MADLRDALQRALAGSYSVEHELEGGGMSRVFVGRPTNVAADGRCEVVGLSMFEMNRSQLNLGVSRTEDPF